MGRELLHVWVRALLELAWGIMLFGPATHRQVLLRGDVKGGKILGEYPMSFAESDPTNIGRGRLLPTSSWDAMFFGVAQWFGISKKEELEYVLPNSNNFGCDLFTDYDLFRSGIHILDGCGGVEAASNNTFQVPEIRVLSGEEQKQGM